MHVTGGNELGKFAATAVLILQSVLIAHVGEYIISTKGRHPGNRRAQYRKAAVGHQYSNTSWSSYLLLAMEEIKEDESIVFSC